MRTSLLRSAVAVAVGLSLVAAGAATAAPAKKKPAPACKLIVDDKGDDGATFPHADSLDIVSGDIASNAKQVTAVIRVAKYSASDSNTAPTGRAWYLEFNVPSSQTPLWLGATVSPTGQLFRYGWVDGSIRRSLGEVTGVIDAARNEIRVTAPVEVWAARGTVKPGSKVFGITAASYNFVGVAAAGGSLQPGDEASAAKSYVAGSPSCVAVGK